MRGGGIITLGLLATILLYAGASYRVRPQMVTRSLRIRMGKVKFEGNRLKVAVIISNPSSETITVNSVVGELYINGKKVGNVESFTRTVIEPNAKTTLYLEVRLMALQLVEMYKQMLEQKGFKLDIGLTGTVNADNRLTPFSINYDVFNYA